MKKTFIVLCIVLFYMALIIGAFFFFIHKAHGQTNPNFWILSGGNLKPLSNSWGLQITATPCTGSNFYQSNGSGVFTCGTPTGSIQDHIASSTASLQVNFNLANATDTLIQCNNINPGGDCYFSANEISPNNLTFRINSGSGISGATIANSLHIGTTTQGTAGAYFDINDTQSNGNGMNGLAINLVNTTSAPDNVFSLKLTTLNVNSNLVQLTLTSQSASSASQQSMVKYNYTFSPTQSGTVINDFAIFAPSTQSITSNGYITRLRGLQMGSGANGNKMGGFAGVIIQQGAISFPSSTIGLYMATQPAGASNNGRVNFAVLAGEAIQMQTGKSLIFQSPVSMATNNYNTINSYGATLLNYSNNGLNLEVDSVSSTLFSSTSSTFKLPVGLQQTLTVTQTSTFNGTINGSTTFSGTVNATGTAPTITSCGTNPSVVGTNFGGIITVGGGVVTSCKLNFATSSVPTFINTPACVLSDNSTAVTPGINSQSSSSVTFGFSATLGGGVVNYICVGMN